MRQRPVERFPDRLPHADDQQALHRTELDRMIHDPNPVGSLFLRSQQFVQPDSQQPRLHRARHRRATKHRQILLKHLDNPPASPQTDRRLQEHFQRQPDGLGRVGMTGRSRGGRSGRRFIRPRGGILILQSPVGVPSPAVRPILHVCARSGDSVRQARVWL